MNKDIEHTHTHSFILLITQRMKETVSVQFLIMRFSWWLSRLWLACWRGKGGWGLHFADGGGKSSTWPWNVLGTSAAILMHLIAVDVNHKVQNRLVWMLFLQYWASVASVGVRYVSSSFSYSVKWITFNHQITFLKLREGWRWNSSQSRIFLDSVWLIISDHTIIFDVHHE